MAVAFITEYARQGRDPSAAPMIYPEEPPTAQQTVAIGVGSVQSAAFNASTVLVRVSVDAVCSIEFGTNPTATATTRRMPANSVEYFAVPLGKGYKVAVITNT